MLLISNRSFAISKIINGDYKVFEFEPNVPVEVPDDIAKVYLENYATKEYIKEFKETSKEKTPEIELPVVSDPPVEEKVEVTVFTEDELNEMEFEDVFGIAKEMGIRPMPNWKQETIVKKIIESQI